MGRLVSSILAVTLGVLATAAWASADSPPDPDIAQLKELLVASQYEDVLTQGAIILTSVTAAEPAQPLKEAQVLNLMVNAAYRGERVMDEQYLVMARRSVDLAEQYAGPRDLATATSLMHLANLYSRRRDPTESIPNYTRAIEILAELGPEHDQQRAVLLSSEGVAMRNLGRYAEAQQLYEQALVIQESRLGPDHPDLATTYNNLAIVVRRAGDYRRARQLYHKALAIREAHFGPDHEWVAETLNNLATVESHLGAYDESLRLQERSVEIFRITLGEDHQRYWWTRLNLGIAYLEMGDHVGALPICLETLSALQKIYGQEHVETTYALDAVGACYFNDGQYELALDYYLESQRLLEMALGVDNPEAGPTIFQVGRCQAALGHLQLGADTMMNSLAIQEDPVGEDSPDLCDLLHRLAEVHLQLGRPADALGFVRRSQKLLEVSVGTEHPLYAASTLLKAQSLAALGETDRAIGLALAAEKTSRQHLQVTMRVLSEARALDYAANRVQGLDVALSLLPSGDASPQVAQVWDAVIQSRAVVLDEFTARNTTLSTQAGPQAVALLDSSLTVRENLANLTLRGPGHLDAAAYIQAMADSRRELDRLDRQLSLADVRTGVARRGRETDHTEVANQLPTGSAMVSYVLYHRPVGPPAEARRVNHIMAIVATGLQDPVAIELGPAKAITQLVKAWRDQIVFGAQIATTVSSRGLVQVSTGSPQNLENYLTAATALRQAVWEPLLPYLANRDRIFIVPTGILHRVNFGALPTGSGLFMAEDGPVLHTLMTERSLVQLAAQSAVGSGVLAIGDPQFGEPSTKTVPDDSPCIDLTSLRFTPLPHARQEVEQLAAIWRKSGNEGQSEITVLTGAAATEQAFKDNIGRHGIIHLATHGFVLDNSCGQDMNIPAGLTHALDLAGLALQGANDWAQTDAGGEDGILTASEISALDMSAVDWAVLSACDTGLGELTDSGEGVFGLCRAFALAGARTVIVSLWPVGDETARDWMQTLYTAHLIDGMSTDRAVQAAYRMVLAERRARDLSVHPYYWAGFTAIGGWQ